MKDRTIALLVDNNNPATLNMVLDLRALFMDGEKIHFSGLDWSIIEHDIIPPHGNLASQDVFVLELIAPISPKKSKVDAAVDNPLS